MTEVVESEVPKYAEDSKDVLVTTSVERPLPSSHPLANKWAFWHLLGNRSKEWEDCLRKLVVVSTVEEFWGVYLKIMPASDLTMGSDYYLFKNGIKPMWEDPKNIKGGRWVVVVDKRSRYKKLDELWLKLMMALTCEQFKDCGELICGGAVNIRGKGDKLALWTSDASQDALNRKTALIFASKLDLPTEQIRYELHKDSSNRLATHPTTPKLQATSNRSPKPKQSDRSTITAN